MIPDRNTAIIRREKRVRSPLGVIVKWTFIGFNLLMLIWVVAGASNVDKAAQAAGGLQGDAMYVGGAIGVGLILAIWTMGAVILGLFALLTRGQTVVIEEGGSPEPLANAPTETFLVRTQADGAGDPRREAVSALQPALKAVEAPPIALMECEACKRQVSSAAAACPSCGHPVSKQPSVSTTTASAPAKDAVWSNYEASSTHEPEKPNRTGLYVAWGAVAALAVGAIVWAFNLSGGSSSTGQGPNAPIEVAIGEPVPFDIYTVTVTSAFAGKVLPSVGWNALLGQSSMYDLNGLAPEGTLFLIVDYAILNSGTKPLPVGSRPTIQLQDQNGTLLNPDEGKTISESSVLGSQKLFSDLNPGIAEKRKAIFEVAEAQFNKATWKLVINGQARVSLEQPQQVVAAPPESVTGAQASGVKVLFVTEDTDGSILRQFASAAAPALRNEMLGHLRADKHFVAVQFSTENAADPHIELSDPAGRIVSLDRSLTDFVAHTSKEDVENQKNHLAVFLVSQGEFDPSSWTLFLNRTEKYQLGAAYAAGQADRAAPSETSAPAQSMTSGSPGPIDNGTTGRPVANPEAKTPCQPKAATLVKGFNTDRAYPSSAVRKGIEGKVTIRYTVDANGDVATVEVIATDQPGYFEEAVKQEFRRMKWNPAIDENCQPVPSGMQTQSVMFQLG